MYLVFRSSSYPCKDSNIHHIQLTIAELSCCPVGGVMLPRAPKRRIFPKTGVSLMPHASDNSYNKHEPTAKGGIRTRACHRKHYVYYMCLVFRSSSYPCKDVKIHHIQITIAELSCCPVGGVMLLRAPKRRIFSETGVSPMPHASDYFIINPSRHVRYQSFLFWPW